MEDGCGPVGLLPPPTMMQGSPQSPGGCMAFWAPERESRWRPCRRVCHALPVREPERLTQRPPFVPKRGHHVMCKEAEELPPFFEADIERFKVDSLKKERRRIQHAALTETRAAQSMVRGLEDWEREHVRNAASTTGTAHRKSATRLLFGGRTAQGTGAGPLRRAVSDARFELRREPVG
uniref:Uncharacterized protein n=1 Tax=Alexandrium andersonii TaxID=327968 RepID=A0A7S2F0U5_9DINO|mmetsp:Transcript_11886/g.26958  ORF Transcript_11886/g.26958 Transcript_11886/m.26958 type:complete len:179 (+) Transcript_11886:43-579(+)